MLKMVRSYLNRWKTSYQGVVDIIKHWNSSNKPEKNIIGDINLIPKKYVDNNDNGYDDYETIHWINQTLYFFLFPAAIIVQSSLINWKLLSVISSGLIF